MLVAISQRNDENKYSVRVDNLENSYADYFEKFGIKLLLIPNIGYVDFYFENFPIEGIILSGGNSIDPVSYGEERKRYLSISEKRDKTESKMLEIAIEKKLPVLGICRGMQFINVFFGGKVETVKNHVVGSHGIKTRERIFDVNSFHDQGITAQSLSSQFKPFAQSSDGVIEGIYHLDLPIVGVQWHPERKSPDEEFNKKLIEDFLRRRSFWK